MDTGQVGAEDDDDIEITPEMIEVGEDVLLRTLGGAVETTFWYPRDLAVEVYRAMEKHRSTRRH